MTRARRTASGAAACLRERRKALALSEGASISQEQMAARTGYALSQVAVSRLELGVVALDEISIVKFNAYARALCWTPWEFQQATSIDLGILPEGAVWRPLPVGHTQTRYSGETS